MGDFLDGFRQMFYPGARIPRVDGWEGLKKFPMARDSEGFFRDKDDSKPYVYYKSVDINGAEIHRRYHVDLDMPEEFDPEKYVTKEDLNTFKEDIVNAVVSQLSAGSAGSVKQPSVPDDAVKYTAVIGGSGTGSGQ